jgi:hypothetical protein
MKPSESPQGKPSVKALITSLLLSLAPACDLEPAYDYIKADQPVVNLPPPEPKKPANAAPIDFSECGEGFKILGEKDGFRYPVLSSRGDATEEQIGCADDKMRNRDCRPVRRTGIGRIKGIPDMFKCDKQGNLILTARPADLIDLNNFFGEGRIGNCEDVIGDFQGRIRAVFERMHCDKDNKPAEELGFGQASGGREYNPCGGGMC